MKEDVSPEDRARWRTWDDDHVPNRRRATRLRLIGIAVLFGIAVWLSVKLLAP